MKIDEPKTPYEAYESEGEEPREELDASLLAARMEAEGHKGPRPRRSDAALLRSPTGLTCLHIAQTCLDRPTCPTNDPYVWTSEEIAA